MQSHKSPFIRVTAVFLFGIFLFTLIALANTAQASSCTHNVTTAAELTNTLSNTSPGQVICLADGTYNDNFVITQSGTAANPITLRGSSAAILEGSGVIDAGYGLHLDNVQYWHLEGFTVQNSQKGIILDSSHHSILDGLTVKDVGDEAVHFRTHSTYNRIQNSIISNTGLREPGFGEGVYIGSANSNWCTYTNCEPDLSHYNEVVNNHFGPDIRAEAVDAKEGTLYGLIEGNTLDGSGVSGVNYADSWIDIKADQYIIRNNIGTNASGNTGLTRGFHVVAGQGGSYGNDNHFEGNWLDFNNTCTKDAFFLSGGGVGNTVCGEPNNTVTNAGCDFASNGFEILSCSDVPTSTPTDSSTTATATAVSATNTPVPPSNTPDPTVALKVQYQVGDSSATDNAMKPLVQIVNEGGTAVSLSDLSLRYWFTNEGISSFNYYCDYAVVGCSNVNGQIVSTNDGHYLEISFNMGAGNLTAGDTTGQIKNRVAKTDWSNFDETNDYSYDVSKTSFADWDHVTLYRNGTLIWGVEPDGSTSPTNTPAPITATATNTVVAPSDTPVPPTATPVTPEPTDTPTVTPTKTSIPTGGDCIVDYSIDNQWSSGFVADIIITNLSDSPVSGYTLTWDFSDGQTFDSGWNATFSQSGTTMSASNDASAWNGTIAANGGSVAFGFKGEHNGSNSIPSMFTLNGIICHE